MTPFRMSALFLFLSGAASLIYQVSWVRLLSLSVGSTSASVGLVLAAFFLGLAVGSLMVSRLPLRFFESVGLYLLIEAVIGISALLLLPLLLSLDQVVAKWSLLSELLPFKFLLVVAVLSVPSIAIGMSYPLMVGMMVRASQKSGSCLGGLYAANTAGAAVGAVGAGFLLIPRLGLDGAIYFGGVLNACVVIAGWAFQKDFLHPLRPPSGSAGENPLPPAGLRKRMLVILFATGVAALLCEVAWTKYLGIYVYTTLYGFSMLLAIFLLGIAMGSWFLRTRLDALVHPRRWMVILLCLLAFTLVLTRVALQYLPMFHTSLFGGGEVETLGRYVLILLILFPSALILGALFVLGSHLYCGSSASGVSRRAGVAYAVNTAGGVTGSLAAGLWLIPVFGSSVTLSMAAATVGLLPLLLFEGLTSRAQRFLAMVAMTILLLGIFYLPHLDFRQVIAVSRYPFDPEKDMEGPPEFRFLSEGRNGVISVTTYDGKRFRLQNNSLPEAVVEPPDPFPWFSETLLGLSPYLFGKASGDWFIVGLGAGTTLSAATLVPVDSITVVEIEPAVVKASHAIFPEGIAALEDHRVKLVFGDARHQLLIGGRRYDAIITQPSHPWLPGSGNFFTREYFELVAACLNEGGISVQWLNLFHMDVFTLRSILKAYFETFPYGMSFAVYQERSLILLGSRQPVLFDEGQIEKRLETAKLRELLRRWRADSPHGLRQYLSWSRSEAMAVAGAAPANQDTTLIPEMRLAGLNGRLEESGTVMTLLLRRFRMNSEGHPKEADGSATWR